MSEGFEKDKKIVELSRKIDGLEKKLEIEDYRSHFFKSESITMILSIVLGLFGILGIGHFYLGKIVSGVLYLIGGIILLVSVVGVTVFVPTIFGIIVAIFYIVIFIVQVLSARKLCEKYNNHITNVGSKPW